MKQRRRKKRALRATASMRRRKRSAMRPPPRRRHTAGRSPVPPHAGCRGRKDLNEKEKEEMKKKNKNTQKKAKTGGRLRIAEEGAATGCACLLCCRWCGVYGGFTVLSLSLALSLALTNMSEWPDNGRIWTQASI